MGKIITNKGVSMALLPIMVNTRSPLSGAKTIINMNKELVKAFVQECKEEQEWEKRWKTNHMQMHDFFKYSGEVEAFTEEYKEYLKANTYANQIKAKLPQKSRKEYFRKYWLNRKLKLKQKL